MKDIPVCAGMPYLQGLRGQETMPPGEATGLNPGHLQRNGFLAVEDHQPTDGTGKGEILIPPAHTLGKGQPFEEFGEDFREDLPGGPPGYPPFQEEVFPPRGLFDPNLGKIHPLFAGKPQGCGSGFALRIEGYPPGRSLDLLHPVGLAFGKPGHQERKPARGTQRPDLLKGKVGLAKSPLRLLGQGPKCRFDETRRKFLATHLKKEIPRHSLLP